MPSEKIQRTLAWLDNHGIAYEVHYHPAIFTIEDCLAYWKNIEATHCKCGSYARNVYEIPLYLGRA